MAVRKVKRISTAFTDSPPSPSIPNVATTKLEELSDARKVVDALATYGVGNWKALGGTDKEQLASGEDGAGHHSFGAVYQALIEQLERNGGVKGVLEIGVQRGGSILLWQHLCPAAKIVGIDIENVIDKAVQDQFDHERVKVLVMNAYDDEAIATASMEGEFSLVIDDGPHTLQSQCDFLSLYLPLLKPGGIAVIEDIQEPSWFERLEKEVPHGFVSERVDRRKINGRWDDLMLVIRKVG